MSLIRLHKWMAQQGIAARRKCEEFIRQGFVKVNGRVVTEMGVKIDPALDTVEIDSSLKKRLLKEKQRPVYLALHKPRGYVSSVTGQEKPKVIDLLKNFRVHGETVRLFPVGRLDKDTSGLLLLTNDGRFAYEMTHPKFEKEKEYEMILPHSISDETLRKLSAGVTIFKKATAVHRKGYQRKTQPAKIARTSPRSFRIILKEGMNRQIRRMCRKVGFPHIQLKRIRIAKFSLKNIPEGKWKVLTQDEVLQYFGYLIPA